MAAGGLLAAPQRPQGELALDLGHLLPGWWPTHNGVELHKPYAFVRVRDQRYYPDWTSVYDENGSSSGCGHVVVPFLADYSICVQYESCGPWTRP